MRSRFSFAALLLLVVPLTAAAWGEPLLYQKPVPPPEQVDKASALRIFLRNASAASTDGTSTRLASTTSMIEAMPTIMKSSAPVKKVAKAPAKKKPRPKKKSLANPYRGAPLIKPDAAPGT